MVSRCGGPSTQTILFVHGQTDQGEERVVHPPGDPIPINVDPFPIRDDIPEDLEIREGVRSTHNVRAGGASKMRAEDVKGWLHGIVEEEEDGKEGTGDN